jgi:hypothetical protein
VHELQEAGWFPFLEARGYDVSTTLPDDEGIGPKHWPVSIRCANRSFAV